MCLEWMVSTLLGPSRLIWLNLVALSPTKVGSEAGMIRHNGNVCELCRHVSYDTECVFAEKEDAWFSPMLARCYAYRGHRRTQLELSPISTGTRS